MSRPPLELLVLLALVSATVTANCPNTRLCSMVCKLSKQLADRCEICHPGICSGGAPKGFEQAVSSLQPPGAKSSATDGGKSHIVVDGGTSTTRPKVPEDLEPVVISLQGKSNDTGGGYIIVDDETPTTPKASEEDSEEDEEDISIDGSGEVDDEGPEPVEREAEDETIRGVAETFDEEPFTGKPEAKETEPEEAGSQEPAPEQEESEENGLEQAEPEAPQTSEAADEKPGKDDGKSEETDPREPETTESEPKPLSKEAKSEENKVEDDKPVEAEERSGEPGSPEESIEDASSSPSTAAPTSSSRSGGGSGLACLHLGSYYRLHSTWFDRDHCNLHVCTIDGVQTTSLTGSCLPPPVDMSHCRRYRPPGECCFTYECQDPDPDDHSPQYCIDSNGVQRPHNHHWVDDPDHPCVRYFCVDGVVVVLSDMRPLCPVPPSHGCTAYQPDGMCCNDFNCTDTPTPLTCLDAQGVRRDNGQIWYDNDIIPCRKYLCNNGTIELLTDLSDSCQEPTEPGCTAVPVSGQCCPTYTNCSCLLNGVEYLSGAVFPDDPTFPCRRLRCDNGTIVTLEERDCPELTCSPTFRRPGQCCYECVGCVYQGIRRPEGSFWYDDAQRPCVLFKCSNSLVTEVNRTECPEAPGPNCQPVLMPGDCCEMFDCSGVTCPYGDQIYHEGDIWVDDPAHPCKWFTCRRTGVQQINNTYCPELVPRDCPIERDPGECCYHCQTAAPVTCFYRGQTYLEGEVWTDDPAHPCKWFTCRRTGVQQINNTYCPELVPRDCPTERDPGECCFRCETTGEDPVCVDLTGAVREEGELYYTDPERCLLARCIGDEEQLLVNRTSLCPSPPLGNCSVVGRVQCCPQYLCHLMPVSNCTDANGIRRNDGEIYANDEEGCLLVQCEEGSERLLVDRTTLCPPPDSPDCVEIGVRDCCPVYDCSGPVNCVDGSGTRRSEGDMYYDDPDQCVLVECSDGEEVPLMNKTERCDPAPENPACTVREIFNCCPVFTCPFCLFNGTTYPIGARWWDNPQRQCVRYQCSQQGLVEQVLTRLPCPEVRFGCTPVRDPPACCHHKYNCMFDADHVLIPMLSVVPN